MKTLTSDQHCEARALREAPAWREVLRIADFDERFSGDYREVSAEVDGDRVFFRVPKHHEIDCRAEPFVGIALLPAMALNKDIEVENSLSMSQKLANALPEIQSIHAFWNTDLRPINVHTSTQAISEAYDRVGSFFSGGVDGSFTLCRNMMDITHLIMLRGLENAGNTSDSWRAAWEKNSAFAHSIGKEIVLVDTNVKDWADKRRIAWDAIYGSVLASMGSLLRVKRLYIASGHTYRELGPAGSHPLLDPMWSTEKTLVVHDGAAFRRGQKVREICKHAQVLDNLRPCWHSLHQNCGRCPKCVRTMTALFLLGASTSAFPKFEYRPGVLSGFKARTKNDAMMLEDALILAKEAKHKQVYRVLRSYHTMYQMRQVVKIMDRYLLEGSLRRAYRSINSLRGSAPKKRLIEVQSAEGWDV